MQFGFSLAGLIVFVLPMLINIVYALFPPTSTREEIKQPIWEIIEQATRILYAIAIVILVCVSDLNFSSIFFYLAIVFLVLYYVVWIRYFIGKRDVTLLGTKFFFIPMPLSVFPVLYFLFASLWLNNYIAFAIMIIFGVAHNVVSYRNLHS